MDDEINPYRTPSAVGEVGFDPHPGGMAVRIRCVRLRAYLTLGSIGLCLLVKAGLALGRASHSQWFVLRPDGGTYAPIEILAGLGILLAFLNYVWFMMWVFRSAQNARLLEGRLSSISPGMAVGSYFIPFYNWVGPMLAMKALAGVIQRFSKGPAAWVGLWWTAWLFAAFASLVDRVSKSPESLHVLEGTAVISLFLTAALVIRLTRQQTFLTRNPPIIPNLPRMVPSRIPPNILRGVPLLRQPLPPTPRPSPRQ